MSPMTRTSKGLKHPLIKGLWCRTRHRGHWGHRGQRIASFGEKGDTDGDTSGGGAEVRGGAMNDFFLAHRDVYAAMRVLQ